MPQPIYAIGDIHGQIDELHRVLGLIEADGGPDAQIVFLGDYVDRGPDSRAVLQFLIDAKAAGCNWIPIKGNHDRYLERFLDNMTLLDPATRPDLFWFNPRLGGDKTMASYGVTAEEGMPVDPIHAAARKAVPQAHRDFLKNLPLTHQTDALLFVHAGIRPKVRLDQQIEDDLIWIRQPFLDYHRSHGPLVVHGHTALDYPEHYGNRVNLDAGAGYFRPLHAAVFEGRECWLLSDTGRRALRP
ncbi:Bis(5'-nucleosyl)-tetraphosphatase, symmetrical [Roseobacter fucihabitans]|uniref:Bis(5'-nucleosyl)-tetraphosphatase, symmetrical n=1 Tax=Roseobacter fucihabitans TaxID=1537242 RepID=A0ABZ2C3M3_9RHOB|nr:metallophosphoesterase family protein [Roseobacter litoralis]MBC6967571.1 Bis(5'-nucleosyl)-tetraphosphatase PrpE (asymmetrical) [Roseobacter litoralis]